MQKQAVLFIVFLSIFLTFLLFLAWFQSRFNRRHSPRSTEPASELPQWPAARSNPNPTPSEPASDRTHWPGLSEHRDPRPESSISNLPLPREFELAAVRGGKPPRRQPTQTKMRPRSVSTISGLSEVSGMDSRPVSELDAGHSNLPDPGLFEMSGGLSHGKSWKSKGKGKEIEREFV